MGDGEVSDSEVEMDDGEVCGGEVSDSDSEVGDGGCYTAQIVRGSPSTGGLDIKFPFSNHEFIF